MAYEVKEEKSKDGRKVLRIPKEDLLDLMKDMKNGGFDSLSLISTVDFRDRVEVVYHLTNSKTEEMLVIKSETRDS